MIYFILVLNHLHGLFIFIHFCSFIISFLLICIFFCINTSLFLIKILGNKRTLTTWMNVLNTYGQIPECGSVQEVLLSLLLMKSPHSKSPSAFSEMYTKRRVIEVSRKQSRNHFQCAQWYVAPKLRIFLQQEKSPIPQQPRAEPKTLPRQPSFSRTSESIPSLSLSAFV